MKKCVFCDLPLTGENISSEHIIHHAIGGLLESEEILCKKCNSELGTSLDSRFVEIFAPITESFDMKTSRNKSDAKYWGKAIDKTGTTFRVQMKGNKIWNVFDENNKHVNRFVEIEDLKLQELEFNISNNDFVLGFKKIAFNYAIHCGINPKELDLIFNFTEKKFSNEKQGIIPFIPMNHFDEQLEIHDDANMTHYIILFNANNFLCAYIDLFNTFQYYVILSESYSGANLYYNYCQEITKRRIDENALRQSVKIWDYKDAHIISMQYGIPLKTSTDKEYNFEKMASSVENEAFNKIRKKSYVTDLERWIYSKTYSCNFESSIFVKDNAEESSRRYKDFYFYYAANSMDLDEESEEMIDMQKFRIYTVDWEKDGKAELYPLVINERIRKYGVKQIAAPYFESKITRLTRELFKKSN
ncbi:MAG: hypothetical protein VR72_14470 [Clostridiaceae bacterium BRH_c20a]|nr:MAG: hypothetical protein VR72_14470 [Clostridiaceae bacterium BRH_c20a]